jgi:ribosome-associated toxin RatA of RatAB toxin-antitoxin module
MINFMMLNSPRHAAKDSFDKETAEKPMNTMRYTISNVRGLFLALSAMICSLLFLPATASCLPPDDHGAAAKTQPSENHHGISVQTSDLDDGVTGVVGKVYINASPRYVWSAITDYNNQKNFVPKLIDSGLISDNGAEQVMFEKGKTGYLLFRKTVYIKLSIRGDYLQRLSFRQVEGDFKVYEGDWIIERAPDGNGTMLTFRAKIKPDFFAPSMFVRKVQQNDLPMVLNAMKKRAESAEVTFRLARASNPKRAAQSSSTCPIVD